MLLDTILLPANLALKISGHSELNALEAKGNFLIDISTRNASLKGTDSS